MGTGIFSSPLCDCHAHLDKTTLGLDWIKNEVKPGLVNLIANEREHRIAWGLGSTARQCATSAALSGTGCWQCAATSTWIPNTASPS